MSDSKVSECVSAEEILKCACPATVCLCTSIEDVQHLSSEIADGYWVYCANYQKNDFVIKHSPNYQQCHQKIFLKCSEKARSEKAIRLLRGTVVEMDEDCHLFCRKCELREEEFEKAEEERYNFNKLSAEQKKKLADNQAAAAAKKKREEEEEIEKANEKEQMRQSALASKNFPERIKETLERNRLAQLGLQDMKESLDKLKCDFTVTLNSYQKSSEYVTSDVKKYYSGMTFEPIDHQVRLNKTITQHENYRELVQNKQPVIIEGMDIFLKHPLQNTEHSYVTLNSFDYLSIGYGLLDSNMTFCQPSPEKGYLRIDFGDLYEHPFGIFLCATRYFVAEPPRIPEDNMIFLNFLIIPSHESVAQESFIKTIEWKEFLKSKFEVSNMIKQDSPEFQIYLHQVHDVKKLRYHATKKNNNERDDKILDQNGSVIPTPHANATTISSSIITNDYNSIDKSIPVAVAKLVVETENVVTDQERERILRDKLKARRLQQKEKEKEREKEKSGEQEEVNKEEKSAELGDKNAKKLEETSQPSHAQSSERRLSGRGTKGKKCESLADEIERQKRNAEAIKLQKKEEAFAKAEELRKEQEAKVEELRKKKEKQDQLDEAKRLKEAKAEEAKQKRLAKKALEEQEKKLKRMNQERLEHQQKQQQEEAQREKEQREKANNGSLLLYHHYHIIL